MNKKIILGFGIGFVLALLFGFVLIQANILQVELDRNINNIPRPANDALKQFCGTNAECWILNGAKYNSTTFSDIEYHVKAKVQTHYFYDEAGTLYERVVYVVEEPEDYLRIKEVSRR